jgi:quinol monooxygenase YgiN
MILVVVKHPVRGEYADQWPTIVEPFTAATRAEPGNICFEWYRSSDDPATWLLLEAFVDGGAGKVHVDSEHFQAAIQRMPHLLRDVPEIINVEVPADGWSRMSEFEVEPRQS